MSASYSDERLSLPAEYKAGKIGVVTVLYNSATVLADFFESVEGQTYEDFAVYCVDNGSTDDSVSQCRARGERYVVIDNGKNLGVAAGNNIGTRAAIADGCEFILFLNNDVVFGPELFAQLFKGMMDYECSMTTPIMYYHDRPKVIWSAGGYFQPWLGYRCLHFGDGDVDQGQYGASRQVPYTPTCCVLVKRHLFSTVGMMDERYFVYYDDTDFMLRSYKSGKSLYLLTDTHLWHKVSSLVGTSSPFRTRYVHRNHALYLMKNVLGFPAIMLSFLYCFSYILSWLVGNIPRQEAFGRIQAWREGMSVR